MFELQPQHEYLVGIDSDGCAFDTMELKHKECFIPNTIKYYDLQGVSKYAREAAEFVNLYSTSRGINRFPALIETLQWLQRRPEVRTRGIPIDVPAALCRWIAAESRLGNPALQTLVQRDGDPDLKRALEWSVAVNDAIADMVHGVPPFPCVRESLQRLAQTADLLVVSATPGDALQAEWQEHDIAKYTRAILGQELGSKKEFLTNAAKYAPGKSLMIGDAPGDYKAAAANHCLFFPINPGHEDASWKRFFEEGIGRFFDGHFDSQYQRQLLAEFERHLPEQPPWPLVE